MRRTRTRPSSRGFALAILRLNRGWSQDRLSEVSGWSSAALNSWENGSRSLWGETLHKLATHMDYEPLQVEGLLLGLSAVVEPFEPREKASLPADLPQEAVRRVRLEAVQHGLLQAREREARLLDKACAERIAGERQAAEILVRRLLPLTPEQREAFRERDPGAGFHTWAFVERACEQSLRELPGHPKAAWGWAVLALHSSIATDPAVEHRLIGYSFAFLGHVHRATGAFEQAEQAFDLWAEEWELGQGATALPLEEWRLFELEAALYRDQGLGTLALLSHERALQASTPEARPLLLLGKAETQESLGESRDALDSLLLARCSLREAHPSDLRILVGWKLADLLSHFGRTQEAIARLSEARALLIEERKADDLSLCLWLQARCEAALGRVEDATKGYRRTRAAFATQQRCHESVEVTLELAQLYLTRGDTTSAKRLAEELGWALKTPGLSQPARACIQNLREAAPNWSAMFPWIQKGLVELRKSRPRSRP